MTTNLNDITKGQRLCVTGRGTANLVHRHVTVTGVTKLYINSTYRHRGTTYKDRHRRDTGLSTPYDPYGGTYIYTTCKNPTAGLRPLDPAATPDQPLRLTTDQLKGLRHAAVSARKSSWSAEENENLDLAIGVLTRAIAAGVDLEVVRSASTSVPPR